MRGLIAGLLLLALMACTPAGAPGAPTGMALASADGLYHPAGLKAVGDSLNLKITASAPRATGYLFTVTTPDTGWTGLPSNVVSATGSLPFIAVHLTPWDSVTFTGCAIGTQGTRQGPQACVSAKFKRGPGLPTVGWDSSLTVTQLIQKPDTFHLATMTGSDVACAYWRALDGKVRINSGQETVPVCMARYDSLPASETLPGYPVAMSYVPSTTQTGMGLKLVLRTPQGELAHVLFAGPFQGRGA